MPAVYADRIAGTLAPMPDFIQALIASLAPGWLLGAVVLDGLCIALLVVWSFAIVYMIKVLVSVPTARAGLAMSRTSPPSASVCMIVPVHNEEGSIGRLVGSVRAQDYPRLTVVLCLDRCTDGTAAAAHRAIAGDPRFRIVEIDSCPDDWAGKVNAVTHGVRTPAARDADLLLFVDADTVLDPACIRACVALLERRQVDLLSLLTTLTGRAWFERVVQPAATYELIRQYPVTRANRRTNPRAFANGQFMLFRRDAYEAVGGHAAVHDELLEDLALARKIAESGRTLGLFDAHGLLTSRMYDSWPAFRDGWKRIYIEGVKRKPARLRKAAALNRFGGTVLPLAGIANIGWSLALFGQDPPAGALAWIGLGLAAAGLGACAVMLSMAYRVARVPLWATVAYPLGAWLLANLLAEAARELDQCVPVRWGGREYVREPR